MNKSLAQRISDLGIPIITEEEHTDKMLTYLFSVLSQGKILDINERIIDALFPFLLGIVMASLVTFASLLGIAIAGYLMGVIFAIVVGILVTFYAAYGIYDLAFQKSKHLRSGFYISLVSMFIILILEYKLATNGLQKTVLLIALSSSLAVAIISTVEFLLFKKYGLRSSLRSGSSGGYEAYITVPPEITSYVQKIKINIPGVRAYLTSSGAGIYKPFSAIPEKEYTLYYYVINLGNEYVHIKGFWPEQRPFKRVAI